MRSLVTAALVVVVGTATVLGATVLARERGAGDPDVREPVPQAPGRVFAISRGDSVNVDLVRGTPTTRCIAISGSPYLSSRYCPPLDTIRSRKAFTVLSPIEGDAPPLVIGFLPSGTSRVAVTAGDSKAIGETRKPLFLAVLAPAALGPTGEEPVTVEFG
jgi:hypothetical protein